MPDFVEKRAESRRILDKYYSVEFSIGREAFVYQFKIRDLSSRGLCILVREDSALLAHLKVGEVLEMKYYAADASTPPDYLKTEVRHITKADEGPYKGHYLVGLSAKGDKSVVLP